MAYCTSEDVAQYAVSTNVDSVLTAIEIAEGLITTYTNDLFEPTNKSFELTLNRNGIAYLPYSAISITSVELTDYETEVAANAYRFTGGRNAYIKVDTGRPWNILVAGMEPWARTSGLSNILLTVNGVYGYESTPAAVKEACALLAATLLVETGKGSFTPAGENTANSVDRNIKSLSVEGYSVTYNDAFTASTTGSDVVDRLLTPYIRNKRSRWS